MELVQIYSVLTKKLIIKKEDWYFISELVVLFLPIIILNVHLFQLNLIEEGAELLQSLLTKLTLLLCEKCQDW